MLTNNLASVMYLSACDVRLLRTVLFKNNTGENGGAIYLNQGTIVSIDNQAVVQFIANTATLNGGAIYVDCKCGDKIRFAFKTFTCDGYLSHTPIFVNNSATVAGNALYFNVQRYCLVNTNVSDNAPDSILNVPCQFNYSQPVNGKMMNIPCDLDYTLLHGTGAPIVTTPHELRLYFPFNDGYNISSTSDHNVYFIRINILGHPVEFTDAVFDYFGKPAEPILFIQLQYLHDTKCHTHTLMGGNYDRVITQSIDNFTVLSVALKGRKLVLNT